LALGVQEALVTRTPLKLTQVTTRALDRVLKTLRSSLELVANDMGDGSVGN